MNDYAGNPSRIEHDLAETRARLGNHLEELTRRLSPGQLVDEGLSYLRDGQGAAFVRNLGAQLRDNPLPVALTAIGIAWAAIASSTSSQPGSQERAVVPYNESVAERARRAGEAVGRGAEDTEDSFRARVAEARARVLGLQQDAAETASAFADRIQEALDSAQERAREWRDQLAEQGERAGEAVSQAAQRGREFAARAGSGIADAVGDNPLLLGALGLAAGVMLGAVLPRTRQEEELLRPVARAAQEATDEVIARGTKAAEAAASAAWETAQQPS